MTNPANQKVIFRRGSVVLRGYRPVAPQLRIGNHDVDRSAGKPEAPALLQLHRPPVRDGSDEEYGSLYANRRIRFRWPYVSGPPSICARAWKTLLVSRHHIAKTDVLIEDFGTKSEALHLCGRKHLPLYRLVLQGLVRLAPCDDPPRRMIHNRVCDREYERLSRLKNRTPKRLEQRRVRIARGTIA